MTTEETKEIVVRCAAYALEMSKYWADIAALNLQVAAGKLNLYEVSWPKLPDVGPTPLLWIMPDGSARDVGVMSLAEAQRLFIQIAKERTT